MQRGGWGDVDVERYDQGKHTPNRLRREKVMPQRIHARRQHAARLLNDMRLVLHPHLSRRRGLFQHELAGIVSRAAAHVDQHRAVFLRAAHELVRGVRVDPGHALGSVSAVVGE